MFDMNVSLPLEEAANLVEETVVKGTFTGELRDRYAVPSLQGPRAVVMVFEKHYLLTGNQMTLTVVLSDLGGATAVHGVGGGGAEGLFRFDWGAASSFEEVVTQALDAYQLKSSPSGE